MEGLSKARICTHSARMRTPPPVLPPGELPAGYKSTLLDRQGPDASTRVKATGYATMVFAPAPRTRSSSGARVAIARIKAQRAAELGEG